MRGEDSIREEEFAKLGLGPAIDDEIGEQVEVGPRMHLMRDAACNNGEDGCGALAERIPFSEKVGRNRPRSRRFDQIAKPFRSQ
jgi:hypothetical protein